MPHEQIPTWERDPSKPGSLAPLRGSKHAVVDAHLHIVNFVQETPGAEELLRQMDAANVAHAVVFALPVTKMWTEYDRERPDYYLANDHVGVGVVVAGCVAGTRSATSSGCTSSTRRCGAGSASCCSATTT